ncbi:hypothetical protein RBB50_006034 [Rhinocladiella similis]
MTSGNPDSSLKLAGLSKKSIFERQKAEAEAKKAREKAETAAVLEDFVKSFEDDGNPNTFPTKRGGFGGGGGVPSSTFGPGPGKRHFTSSGLKSGPGSLGPTPSLPKSGPGSLGPSPSFGKKRHYDDYSGGREGDQDRGRDRDRRDRTFSYGDRGRDARRDSGFAGEEEESKDAEEMKAAAKPTLRLSSLPPGTSTAVIKGLFAASPLNVDNVRILPKPPGSINERNCLSAIVTLAAETPATDIDTMVSHLQNQYLGFGFNLSISRHLSSAALSGSNLINAPSTNINNLPFGAKPIPQHTSLSRAPPPSQGPGRFAPPASYTSPTPYGSRQNLPPTQVTVQIPNDLKQIRLINKTIESLLTYGPEFEALLMSRPEIQRDEQWAWLWNSGSTGGVYYRWRLWEILTNAKSRKRRQQPGFVTRPQGDTIFEGQSVWVPPEETLKFEYTTKVEEFVSDEDYNSSDEEDAEESNLARRYHDHQKVGGNAPENPLDTDGTGYLNPLAKTKLVHLLSRLPESNAKLRRGDVARITGFAIEHAGAGADEVAALITRNVIKPFCYTVKRPDTSSGASNDDHDDQSDDNMPPSNHNPSADAAPGIDGGGGAATAPTTASGDANLTLDGEDPSGVQTQTSKSKVQDMTPSSLVGLYVISDILSSSASAGVRHAWRYRSLFETQLRVQRVFATLGRAARDLNWGKLKADKWRRSVQSVFSLWEGWCVFPSAAHEDFVQGFLNPPLTAKEVQEQDELLKRQEAEKVASDKAEKDKVSKWKSVSVVDDHGKNENNGVASSAGGIDVDARSKGTSTNMDGRPMDDDTDDDNNDDNNDTIMHDVVQPDPDLDGVSMVDSSEEEEEEEEENVVELLKQQQRDDKDKDTVMQEHAHAQETDSSINTVDASHDPKSEAMMEMSTATAEAEEGPHGSASTSTSKKAASHGPQVSHAKSQGQGRRVRPRAADFDDMFE